MSKPMIAFCGLECTVCPAYLATQTSDLALAERTAKEWSEQFHVDVKVENVWCDGCLVGGKKCAHCLECEIRACGQKRGVANCGLCDDYPCATVSPLLGMVPDAKVRLDSIHAGRV